ncbi:tyrosine-type recombinase/integrase [Escherichia coli]|uniref:phage integrase n=3 Tax=Escherichia coli TaxID=562 RepID=UPI000F5F7286|nr:tyrosine-type recombinase/integrase [Escherichia coli]DAJ84176.1 MAG TPA: integrase [Caudoviricetes sp.]EEW2908616.1 site-specific integrase [Escherichia coli]EEW7218758.1 site-specific integrase [Escherichia coli]EFE8610374.1 tyrosine-type recombinase/integrase [Escherichia coli]EFN4257369.1 tyrosine-type recombinase/integrase [Escherichia coli]
MAVTKLANGKWQAQVFPNGRDGRRVRRLFATKGEALAFERYIKDQTIDKPWLGEKKDKRRVIDLVDTWFNAHGITLSDGQKRKDTMEFACIAMGNPLASEFNAKLFASYREQRLSGKITRSNRVKAVTPRTVNLELAYFRAMFNELKRLDDWMAPNPLENIREFKIDEAELSWLTVEEVKVLLAECEKSRAKDLSMIVQICLATGARWGEAESLSGMQISPGKITFTKTKGKKNRTVPISDELYEMLPRIRTSKPLFKPCYSAFRTAIKRAKIELPDGQLSHVLRHTFASHFMMGGGNILVLQRILGHTDIKVTMRYAHFSPDHLTEAVELNPLNHL